MIPGVLRVMKELSEIELSNHFSMEFPEEDNVMNFLVIITPDEGFWNKKNIKFSINIPNSYPYDYPKVKCLNKILHPNISENGNLCLDIFREQWKPIYSIENILYGIFHILLEPSCSNPLNKEAAVLLESDPIQFSNIANNSICE